MRLWGEIMRVDGQTDWIAHQVDEPVSLEVSLASQWSGAIEEDPFDLKRLTDELPADREECRDCSGDVRGGHARAAVVDVARLAVVGPFVTRDALRRLRQLAARGARRDPFSGATKSGLSRPSPVGPFDEKNETPKVCGESL